MTDELHPALTEEEWIQYGDDRSVLADFAAGRRAWGPRRRHNEEDKMHAAAALALFRHPFGFTHEDVQLLEDQATFHEHRGAVTDQMLADRLRWLAQRIAALLPPPGVEPTTLE